MACNYPKLKFKLKRAACNDVLGLNEPASTLKFLLRPCEDVPDRPLLKFKIRCEQACLKAISCQNLGRIVPVTSQARYYFPGCPAPCLETLNSNAQLDLRGPPGGNPFYTISTGLIGKEINWDTDKNSFIPSCGFGELDVLWDILAGMHCSMDTEENKLYWGLYTQVVYWRRNAQFPWLSGNAGVWMQKPEKDLPALTYTYEDRWTVVIDYNEYPFYLKARVPLQLSNSYEYLYYKCPCSDLPKEQCEGFVEFEIAENV